MFKHSTIGSRGRLAWDSLLPLDRSYCQNSVYPKWSFNPGTQMREEGVRKQKRLASIYKTIQKHHLLT